MPRMSPTIAGRRAMVPHKGIKPRTIATIPIIMAAKPITELLSL
jgi:hypothetical protein